jgi:hypothetical protein
MFNKWGFVNPFSQSFARVQNLITKKLKLFQRVVYKKFIISNPKKLVRALNNGLSVHEVDGKGNTLFHYAVMDNHLQSAQILLKYDPDLTRRNHDHFTCMELAQFLDRKQILSLLEASFTPPNLEVIQSDRKSTVLSESSCFRFEYVSYLVFNSSHLFNRVVKKVKKYPLNSRISVERKWLGALYKPYLNGCFTPRLSIQFIDSKMGHGLFAGQVFKAGEFIGEYTGEVKRSLFFKSLSNPYVGEYALGGRDPVRFVIDARNKGNYTRFINHSDCPNASAITVIAGGLLHVVLFAEKKIGLNEEITFDYGPNYWKKRKKKKTIA